MRGETKEGGTKRRLSGWLRVSLAASFNGAKAEESAGYGVLLHDDEARISQGAKSSEKVRSRSTWLR